MTSPSRRIVRISEIVLVAVILAVTFGWLHHWWTELTDPGVQIDDARTHLVGYHRFDRDPSLTGDPVTGICMAMQPPFPRLFYRLVTPLTGVPRAAKWAQLLCILISLAAAAVLARSPRWGLAAGALLGAFALAFPWWVGGTPRQFGPPLLALYIAGILARQYGVRFVAAVVAAGTYPSAAILMLATECLLVTFRLGKEPWAPWRLRLTKAVIMVAVCAAVAIIPRPGEDSLGPVITLAEAKTSPDYRDGARRLDLTPSSNPVSKSIQEVLFVFGFLRVNPDTKEQAGALKVAASWLALAAVGWLTTKRYLRIPAPAVGFFIAGTACYWIAWQMAYRLYIPYRYSEYGMGAAGTVLFIGLLTRIRLGSRRAWMNRATANFAAAGCLAVLWLYWGTSDRFSGTANISRAPRAALYDFVGSLPKDSRIASHPYDGDDVPFWAARATLCGYELDQPFFTRAWHDALERTRSTFGALYATDPSSVISFCDRWHITHLLLRPDRYGENFRKRVKYCDPFDAENKRQLRDIKWDQLVLAHPPETAVIFRDDRFLIVEVDALRRAWAAEGAIPATAAGAGVKR